MKKKSLIKSRAATKKALIASRKGSTGKVNSANVAAGVAAGTAPQGALAATAPAASAPVTAGVAPSGALAATVPSGSISS